MDGKTARGSRTDVAPAAHLLSALTAAGRTVSQLRVPDKTDEITGFTALLNPFDLTGTVATADALHTRREYAKWLVEVKNAHYLLAVKGNQPRLHAVVRALPWKEVTARRYDREAGHGRHETRSVRTLTVTDLGLDFPHVVRAVKILRHRTDLKTGKVTQQTVHAITDMTAHEASPQLISRITRAQRSIEAVHHIRDTTFTEDASKIQTGHGPEDMTPEKPRDQHPPRRRPPQHRRGTPRDLLRALHPPTRPARRLRFGAGWATTMPPTPRSQPMLSRASLPARTAVGDSGANQAGKGASPRGPGEPGAGGRSRAPRY